MTDKTCAICLDDMTEDSSVFTLSCDHSYHTQCFKSLVCQTGHSFVDCPLCRAQNTRNTFTHTDDPETFLKTWFSGDTSKPKRCCHTTNGGGGTRCKKKAVFLNNGSCRTHQADVLDVDRYPLFAEYVNKVLGNILRWTTKVFLIDLTKQLIIRYPEIQTMGDIEHRMNTYYHMKNKEDQSIYDGARMNVDPTRIYEYYGVPAPNPVWVSYSIRDRTLT